MGKAMSKWTAEFMYTDTEDQARERIAQLRAKRLSE